MDAVEVSQPGGPEVLRLCKRPVPETAPEEVLIQVVSAGLNGADLSQRKGTYPMPDGITDIPGLEVAGNVVALGCGVEKLAQHPGTLHRDQHAHCPVGDEDRPGLPGQYHDHD